MVTMRDVADAAGVSAMTVSNVLAGRNVRSETRERVLAVVEQTGYRVNVAAQNLRRRRTGVVGLAVHELDSHYFSMLAARLTARLAREGLRLVVEQTGASRQGELAAISGSRVNAYDGLLLSASDLSAEDVAALAGDLPVVMLGERQDLQRFDHVEMANTAGARDAAQLLLDRGCRRLAAVGLPQPAAADGSRRDAFRLRAAGVAAAVEGSPAARVRFHESATYRAADGLRLTLEALQLEPRTDGLVCATDTLALGALRGPRRRGAAGARRRAGGRLRRRPRRLHQRAVAVDRRTGARRDGRRRSPPARAADRGPRGSSRARHRLPPAGAAGVDPPALTAAAQQHPRVSGDAAAPAAGRRALPAAPRSWRGPGRACTARPSAGRAPPRGGRARRPR